MYSTDMGFDLRYTGNKILLQPGQSQICQVGTLADNDITLTPGQGGIVLGRSGMRRNLITCDPGAVDQGFDGIVEVLLTNRNGAECWEVKPGDRIAQLVIIDLAQFIIRPHRGELGYGSSGR